MFAIVGNVEPYSVPCFARLLSLLCADYQVSLSVTQDLFQHHNEDRDGGPVCRLQTSTVLPDEPFTRLARARVQDSRRRPASSSICAVVGSSERAANVMGSSDAHMVP